MWSGAPIQKAKKPTIPVNGVNQTNLKIGRSVVTIMHFSKQKLNLEHISMHTYTQTYIIHMIQASGPPAVEPVDPVVSGGALGVRS